MTKKEYTDFFLNNFTEEQILAFFIKMGFLDSEGNIIEKKSVQEKKKLAPIAEEVEHDDPVKKDVFSDYFDNVNKKREEDD